MSWIFGVSIVAWVLLNMATHDGTTLPHPFSVDVPTHPTQPQFPLLETMLRSLGRTLQPTYTCRDLACLFGVTTRTIQSKVADGTIPSRKLIGGARFLPIDIEEYLRRASNPPAIASLTFAPASRPNELPRWLAFTRYVFPLASTTIRKASLCFAFYPRFHVSEP
jgi:hypothetical protein